MANGLWEKVGLLAERARRDSMRGRHETAIQQQQAAVTLCKELLEDLAQDDTVTADELQEAAHRLSDQWGRLGGVHRRAGQATKAIEAYREGAEIEQRYRLDDSYNLTNWIVSRVLDEPARLPALSADVKDAIGLIEDQVEGPRRDQWWAWADLGLLYLLAGRIPEARRAYDRMPQTGARPVDYDKSLTVLRTLQQRLQSPAADLAADIGTTIITLESYRQRS